MKPCYLTQTKFSHFLTQIQDKKGQFKFYFAFSYLKNNNLYKNYNDQFNNLEKIIITDFDRIQEKKNIDFHNSNKIMKFRRFLEQGELRLGNYKLPGR